MITVLITGCAKHSMELVRCLKNNEDNILVRVVSTNMNEHAILRTGVDAVYIMKPITDKNYIHDLIEVCKKEKVDVIIPYITAELPLLARKKKLFEENGIKVSIADKEAIDVLNDKIIMHEKYGKFMPMEIEVHSSKELHKALDKFKEKGIESVCCKINSKCGGTGFAILDEEKAYDISLFNRCKVNRYVGISELEKIADRYATEIILQEYIQGTDYSVCVLANKGRVTEICGYAGYEMEFGSVVDGEVLKNDNAYKISKYIAENEKLDGNACFDFMLMDNGDVKLLECNPRVNASIGFVWKAGANLMWLRCKALLGMKCKENHDIKYGLRMMKYYEAAYF